MKISTIVVAAALVIPTRVAVADVITDWNEKAVTLVTKMSSEDAERVIVMVHVAMFDAVNSIERRYRPYLVQMPAAPTTSKEAAATAAAGAVLMGLLPQATTEVTKETSAYLAAIPDGEARSAGIELGKAVAAKILEARADDGSNAPDAYRPRAKAGVYVPTALTRGSVWPNVKPFALNSASQFRSQPPVALNSEQYAADFNEIKRLGGKTSTERSAQQTENARFWLAAGPVIYYPVVRQLAAAKTQNVVDSARFMALVAVARSDAFIAVFDAKYAYEFWRPLTAIRNGDIDDNPATERDPTWQPIADTPMHPEYPCAHCTMSATIAGVVETVFGTADVPELTLTSPTMPGVTHRWTSMRAFIDEVAEARIFAGFHYRFSTRAGQELGRNVGEYVAKSAMQPAVTAEVR
jgi:hypothetical protein